MHAFQLKHMQGELGRVFQGPSLEQPRMFNVSQNAPHPDHQQLYQ